MAEFIINLGGDGVEQGKFHTVDCDDNETSKNSDRLCLAEPLSTSTMYLLNMTNL